MPEVASRSPIPFWIDDGAIALFAWLDMPHSSAVRSTGVVIVPPLGYEALCAHSTLRALAARLSEAGFPVLRYDHPGSGDSAGSESDPALVPKLIDGVRRAIDALERHTSVTRVALVGLRMGALLALQAAEQRSDIASLILWAPPNSGRSYVRELAALGAFQTTQPSGSDLDEVCGFQFSPETRADLARIQPLSIRVSPQTNVLVIPRDDLPNQTELGQILPFTPNLLVDFLPGFADAVRDPHDAKTSPELLDGICAFLERTTASDPRLEPSAVEPPALSDRVALKSRADSTSPIVEEAVRFGSENRLFGILTHAPKPVGSTAVLWLNPGAIHRVGMNRNYVTFARDLAERGIPSLRFDFSGLGDSAPPEPARDHLLYSREVVSDVQAAIDYMQAIHGIEHFVLAGLCAGAYAAFHAAVADVRVMSTIAINPQTFDFRPGDSLEIRRRKTYQTARWYRRSAMRPESWLKALRGEVDVSRVTRLLFERLTTVIESKLRPRAASSAPTSVKQALSRLGTRGSRLLLIYSADDPGLDYLREHLGDDLDTLRLDPRFKLEVIDGPDHTFTPLASQRELFARIARHLVRHHGARKHADSVSHRARTDSRPIETRSVITAARRTTKQAAAHIFPRSWLVVHGPRRDHRIALTFDDGPTELTRAYLDVLEHYGIRATFFFVGRACERWPIEAAEVARRGHAFASHGYTHRTFPELGTRALLSELTRTHDLLPSANNRRPWVRPPHGAVTPRSLFDCARAGFSTVLWSYDSGDSLSDSPREILDGFSRNAPKPGDIILLHEDRPPTLEALPELIEHLLSDGYDLVTIDELFH